MRTMMTVIAGGLTIGIMAPQAPAQGPAMSCTAKWLTHRQGLPILQRYDRAHADAFGKDCLKAAASAPIDRAVVRKDLRELLDDGGPLAKSNPTDMKAFCPGYTSASTAQRSDVWRELIYQIIRPESGYNAHAVMWEQPRDRDNKPVNGGEYSIGLLQLSISNRGPFNCDIPDEASLLDPRRNLACGVKIVTKLVTRDNRIGGDTDHGRFGLGRYWSTIRVVARKPGASGRRDTRQPIVDAVRRLPQCQV